MMSTVLQLKVTAAKPVKRGRAYYWSVMMEYAAKKQQFTIADIDGATSKGSVGDIKKFMRFLVAANIVKRVGSIPRNAAFDHVTYRVAKMETSTPRFRNDGTLITHLPLKQHIWNFIRGPVARGGFTIDDIVRQASTDEVKIERAAAYDYIYHLHAAGYVQKLQGAGNHRNIIWGFLPDMKTGPLAPKVLRAKVVYDANTGKVMGEPVAEEEHA